MSWTMSCIKRRRGGVIIRLFNLSSILMRCALIIIIFLVMWVDDYSPDLGLFSARCDYLKPSWTDIRHRIIDVGFLGISIFLIKCSVDPPSPLLKYCNLQWLYLFKHTLTWNSIITGVCSFWYGEGSRWTRKRISLLS